MTTLSPALIPLLTAIAALDGPPPPEGVGLGVGGVTVRLNFWTRLLFESAT